MKSSSQGGDQLAREARYALPVLGLLFLVFVFTAYRRWSGWTDSPPVQIEAPPTRQLDPESIGSQPESTIPSAEIRRSDGNDLLPADRSPARQLPSNSGRDSSSFQYRTSNPVAMPGESVGRERSPTQGALESRESQSSSPENGLKLPGGSRSGSPLIGSLRQQPATGGSASNQPQSGDSSNRINSNASQPLLPPSGYSSNRSGGDLESLPNRSRIGDANQQGGSLTNQQRLANDSRPLSPVPERSISASGSNPTGLPSPLPDGVPDQDRTDEPIGLRLHIGESDSCWSIAERAYGSGQYFRALHSWLQTHGYPGELPAGKTIVLPDADTLSSLYPNLAPLSTDRLADSSNKLSPSRSGGSQDSAKTIVTRGKETLFEIAAKHLGQASRYDELLELNKQQLPPNIGPSDPLPAELRLRVLR